MDFTNYFPIWKQLTPTQQHKMLQAVEERSVKKGSIIHNGSNDCSGLVLVKEGQLRAYILSEEGREITLYRLFDYDLCLFSASCMLRSIQFEIIVEAQKDSTIYIIPSEIYKSLTQESLPLANYTNELMATRFSDVMWLLEQIMWKNLDQRLANYLLEECELQQTSTLKLTHEQIANHLGTHREVITRMLKYFQSEEIVHLSRGSVTIINPNKLTRI